MPSDIRGNVMIYKAYLRNSLDTVFYNSDISADNLKYTSMLKNECFSFQVSFTAELEPGEGNGWNDVVEIRAEVRSEIKDKISVYIMDNVPVMRIGYSTADDWFLRKDPGLYPDYLSERKNNFFSVPTGYWKNIWFNVNEELEELYPKEYKISIKFYDRKTNALAAEKELTINVLDANLPKQSIIATNWVHYDCIAHFSNTKPFSKKFFEAAESYIRLAAKNGQNMILTPAFTPPLDTPIGEERATAQLVGVERKNGKYIFDFSLLKKFIELALKCKIEYFEHSHLFTQWGAKNAPKIIVRVNGKNKKLFGWHTDAASDEYKNFLHEYLTELKVFLKDNGYEKRFFFHISDEPIREHLESYGPASSFMHKELEDYPSGDALSDYEFYENGLVQTPIVVTRRIKDFLGRAKPLWLYYTGYECDENMSNRVIGMPQVRGRILGTQLYYFNIDGFLQWGFNAHHNRQSRLMTDPRISSDMDGDFTGGTSYLVYPNGKKAEPSLRLMTFRDQMQDTRAFKLLETLTDREYVCGIIKKHIPDISFNCRVTAEQMLDLRNEINLKIKALQGEKNEL